MSLDLYQVDAFTDRPFAGNPAAVCLLPGARDPRWLQEVARFFAPGAGVDEDPVTGSAHCTLGPYWAARLGKDDLLAYQASARGGVARVRVDAAREEGERMLLGGQAVTVLEGKLAE